MKPQNDNFIHIRLDDRGLWTADLRDQKEVFKNLGGSYPKSQSATLDAKLSWGLDLPIKVGELAADVVTSIKIKSKLP